MKRVSLECFTWVRGVADAGAKERSLCAEFSWCERQSSPVPPSLCLTSSFGVLVLFPGMCPIFFGCFFYFKFGFFLFAVAWMLIAVGMPHRSLYLVTWKLSSISVQLFFSVAGSALQEAVALHWSHSSSIKSLCIRWLFLFHMRAPANWAVPVRKVSSPAELLPGFPTTHWQVMHYEKQHWAFCWQDSSPSTAVLRRSLGCVLCGASTDQGPHQFI